MLLAPIGNPEPRDFTPLDTPYIFLENGTQTVKMQFDTIPQKIQNRCNLHPCGDENYSGFRLPLFLEIEIMLLYHIERLIADYVFDTTSIFCCCFLVDSKRH